ncbi:MAG TPA: hypothetical protein DCL54_00425, partial [Alphaproteobacteria bacterium]|nr:hypothetical protein [Alphaproteobacteria bacterium]
MLISSSDPLLPTSRAGAVLWTVAGLASLAAVTTAPVLTFLILIVGFGLMHVLTELRYVDARFSGRVQRRWLLLALALVGAIALTRVFLIAQWIPYGVGIGLEVALGIALAILGAWAAPGYRLAVGVGVLIFTAIAIASPLHALLTIAVLHNLTPLGFLAERLRAPERGPVLMILSIPFVAIPLLIASGLPLSVAHSLFGFDPGWAPFAAGPA